MLKMIEGSFQYDNTGAADTDRAAFETTLNTEIDKGSVVKAIAYRGSSATSYVVNDATNRTICKVN